MDLLDRLLEHDAWTTRLLLNRCEALPDEQLDQPFEIGHRTLRETFRHIIANVDVWSRLMSGDEVKLVKMPLGIADLMVRLDEATVRLSGVAHAVAERGGWDEEWTDVLDTPPAQKTYGSGIAHILTHSMHHRAQLLFMLRQLGIEDLPEGDIFSWEKQSG